MRNYTAALWFPVIIGFYLFRMYDASMIAMARRAELIAMTPAEQIQRIAAWGPPENSEIVTLLYLILIGLVAIYVKLCQPPRA